MRRFGWLVTAVLLGTSPPAAAQVDFSGQWAPLYHEDNPERIPGPEPGDYTGLPLNEAARLQADSWDADRISVVMSVPAAQQDWARTHAELMAREILATSFEAAPTPGAYSLALACAAAPACSTNTERLCLNNRFLITTTWKDFSGNTGTGKAIQLTPDTGSFWFFNAENLELMIKALDGRTVNGKWWIFYGALSNVEYTINVVDTVTGAVKTYSNPSGTFASRGDTNAF